MDKLDFECRISLPTPASSSVGSRSSYPGGRAQREDNHLPPSSVEVKNEWSNTSTPLIRVNGMCREILFIHMYKLDECLSVHRR